MAQKFAKAPAATLKRLRHSRARYLVESELSRQVDYLYVDVRHRLRPRLRRPLSIGGEPTMLLSTIKVVKNLIRTPPVSSTSYVDLIEHQPGPGPPPVAESDTQDQRRYADSRYHAASIVYRT